LWDQLDAFIHIDAVDIGFVYDWRIQQEHALIKAKGSGMTDNTLRSFVDGYMPAYELYVDGLRTGLFVDKKGRQLRIECGKNREILSVVTI